MESFPQDQWVEIPSEELTKLGKTSWVYKPSNYEPIAMDAQSVPLSGVVQINCPIDFVKKMYQES